MKIIKISKVERSIGGFMIQLTPEDLHGPNCNAIKVIEKLQQESVKVPSVNTEEDDITDMFDINEYAMQYYGECQKIVVRLSGIPTNKLLAIKIVKDCCKCSLKEAKDCIDAHPETVTFVANKYVVESFSTNREYINSELSMQIISEDYHGKN